MFENHKFRCHALGKLMVEGRAQLTENQKANLAELFEKVKKKPLTPNQQAEFNKLIYKRDNPDLSDTTKSYLIQVYIKVRFGRSREIYSKYLEKGLAVEEDSITTYSRHKGKMFKKNTERLENEFISGEPDLFQGTGKNIRTDAEEIDDIKSSWDIFTFFSVLLKPLNTDYYWQMQGYMWLTPAQRAIIAYVLSNTPLHLVEAEVYKMKNYMGIIDPDGPDENAARFREAEKELRDSMNFDNIPIDEKIIEFQIEKNDPDIDKIPIRVVQCRKWLDDFHIQVTTGKQMVKLPSDKNIKKLISEVVIDQMTETIEKERGVSKITPFEQSIKDEIGFSEKSESWFIERVGKTVKRRVTAISDFDLLIITDLVTAKRMHLVLQGYKKQQFADAE